MWVCPPKRACSNWAMHDESAMVVMADQAALNKDVEDADAPFARPVLMSVEKLCASEIGADTQPPARLTHTAGGLFVNAAGHVQGLP